MQDDGVLSFSAAASADGRCRQALGQTGRAVSGQHRHRPPAHRRAGPRPTATRRGHIRVGDPRRWPFEATPTCYCRLVNFDSLTPTRTRGLHWPRTPSESRPPVTAPRRAPPLTVGQAVRVIGCLEVASRPGRLRSSLAHADGVSTRRQAPQVHSRHLASPTAPAQRRLPQPHGQPPCDPARPGRAARHGGWTSRCAQVRNTLR